MIFLVIWYTGAIEPLFALFCTILHPFAPFQLTVFGHLRKEDLGGCKELLEL